MSARLSDSGYVEDVAWLVSDGGCIGKNPSYIGGTWCYVLMDEHNKRILHECGVVTPSYVNLPRVTNNLTEMLALVNALKRVPNGWEGRCLVDSQVTIGRVWKDWAMSGIPEWLETELKFLKMRLNFRKIRSVLVQGHPTRAELAAKRGKTGLPVSHQNCFCDLTCSSLAKAVLAAQVPHEEANRLLEEYLKGGVP